MNWEVAVPAAAELGERPFWDAAQDCLMWVDINAGHLHSYRPGAGGEIVLDLSGVALGAAAPHRGGTTFYFIGSGEPEPRIRAFAHDPVSGDLGPSRDLVRFPGGGAVPDGLVVDGEDTLWVAIWGAGQVHRYAPDGELLTVLPVPASQPTCPAFGGPALDELYLTTAWEGMTGQRRAAEPLAGHVLRARPGARGHPVPAFGG